MEEKSGCREIKRISAQVIFMCGPFLKKTKQTKCLLSYKQGIIKEKEIEKKLLFSFHSLRIQLYKKDTMVKKCK